MKIEFINNKKAIPIIPYIGEEIEISKKSKYNFDLIIPGYYFVELLKRKSPKLCIVKAHLKVNFLTDIWNGGNLVTFKFFNLERVHKMKDEYNIKAIPSGKYRLDLMNFKNEKTLLSLFFEIDENGKLMESKNG
jgi:hypothetical protein